MRRRATLGVPAVEPRLRGACDLVQPGGAAETAAQWSSAQYSKHGFLKRSFATSIVSIDCAIRLGSETGSVKPMTRLRRRTYAGGSNGQPEQRFEHPWTSLG